MSTSVDFQEQNTQSLSDIQNLQSIELELFSKLETGIANNTLTSDKKDSIISQINNISQMRVNLYQNMNTTSTFFQNNITELSSMYGEQTTAVEIVEKELNTAKERLKAVQDDKFNKLRLIEINTYYGEKYSDHANIMKSVVLFCIPIIIIAVLANQGILPEGVYKALFIIVIVFGIIYIWRQILDAMSHDNMNYQEYLWGTFTPPTTTVDTNTVVDDSNSPWSSIGITCIGQNCCSADFTYVPSPTNICVANASLPEGVAAFVPQTTSSTSTSTATV